MPMIDADGISFAYDRVGDGPTVVFLHGFPFNRNMWRGQVEDLREVADCIAVDLRGFGESTGQSDMLTMDRHAEDVRSLLEAWEVREPVVLCGLSMGGYVAFEFARRYPERLAGMILCDTKAAADSEEGVENRRKAAAEALKNGVAKFADTMPEKLLSSHTLKHREEMVDLVRGMIRKTAAVSIAGGQHGMSLRADHTAILGELDVPTLVICGKDDSITPPEQMRQMATAIPGARFEAIPEAGHLAPLENPTAVNAAIRTFLAER